MRPQNVYVFSEKGSDGDQTMKELLGGKGANLAEMCNIGLSVPPGMTITTETCKNYNDNGEVTIVNGVSKRICDIGFVRIKLHLTPSDD